MALRPEDLAETERWEAEKSRTAERAAVPPDFWRDMIEMRHGLIEGASVLLDRAKRLQRHRPTDPALVEHVAVCEAHLAELRRGLESLLVKAGPHIVDRSDCR